MATSAGIVLIRSATTISSACSRSFVGDPGRQRHPAAGPTGAFWPATRCRPRPPSTPTTPARLCFSDHLVPARPASYPNQPPASMVRRATGYCRVGDPPPGGGDRFARSRRFSPRRQEAAQGRCGWPRHRLHERPDRQRSWSACSAANARPGAGGKRNPLPHPVRQRRRRHIPRPPGRHGGHGQPPGQSEPRCREERSAAASTSSRRTDLEALHDALALIDLTHAHAVEGAFAGPRGRRCRWRSVSSRVVWDDEALFLGIARDISERWPTRCAAPGQFRRTHPGAQTGFSSIGWSGPGHGPPQDALVGAFVHRPRPLQDDQRHLGLRRWRRTAATGRHPPARRPAPGGYGGRYGGDEFAVLPPELQDGALSKPSPTNARTSSPGAFDPSGPGPWSHASVGIAIFPRDAENWRGPAPRRRGRCNMAGSWRGCTVRYGVISRAEAGAAPTTPSDLTPSRPRRRSATLRHTPLSPQFHRPLRSRRPGGLARTGSASPASALASTASRRPYGRPSPGGIGRGPHRFSLSFFHHARQPERRAALNRAD